MDFPFPNGTALKRAFENFLEIGSEISLVKEWALPAFGGIELVVPTNAGKACFGEL
jgi:hypothetical protein